MGKKMWGNVKWNNKVREVFVNNMIIGFLMLRVFISGKKYLDFCRFMDKRLEKNL